nr:IS3 family transposase [Ectothiorhodospira mobilis]
MRRLLAVSPSGYYAWRQRPTSTRARQDAALTERIRALHGQSRGTYGVPRIHADLAAEGWRVGRKRVARLMRSAGLRGVSRRRFAVITQSDQRVRPAPDRVDRSFTAAAPDQLYVGDITFIPTWEGFLYLATVLTWPGHLDQTSRPAHPVPAQGFYSAKPGLFETGVRDDHRANSGGQDPRQVLQKVFLDLAVRVLGLRVTFLIQGSSLAAHGHRGA